MNVDTSWILRAAGTLLSPAGPRARLTVLIYHRVLREIDPMFPEEVNAAQFESQIVALTGNFTVLPLAEAVERLKRKSLPPRAAAITFDDGYADNYEIAFPILRRHKVTATFFIASGFLDGGRMWNDTVIEAIRAAPAPELDLAPWGKLDLRTWEARGRSAFSLLARLKHLEFNERAEAVEHIAAEIKESLPGNLMMTSAQVRELHASGMGMGAHTAHHPILARLNSTQARAEIADGRAQLQEIIRAPVALFAYPNGKPQHDYTAEHVEMVKELGFSAAFSTAWGVARGASDFYQLPRFTPWDKTPVRFVFRLLQNTLRLAPAS
ncbi:MAG: polysaccharide deacetylase family protein [Burkholderiales bacterium]